MRSMESIQHPRLTCWRKLRGPAVGSGLSWLLLEAQRMFRSWEQGLPAQEASGIFPFLKQNKNPSSSHISCNCSSLCIWNKEGLGRFKAADRVELDFTAKNSQT